MNFPFEEEARERTRPFNNCFNLLSFHLNSFYRYYMAQEFYFSFVKATVGFVCEELFYSNDFNTISTCLGCNFQLLHTSISSKNTKRNFLRRGWNRSFITYWNIAGAFDKPMGITWNLYSHISIKASFWNVLFTYSYLIITTLHIKFQ